MAVNAKSKRLFDVVASAAALIVLFPVFVAVGLLVWRASGRHVFFVQTRLGLGEKPFPCFKFRTLVPEAPITASHDIDSSWVTPVGRRLRAAKLDELPQLLNVLRGEMSLVGPRPCPPSFTKVVEARRKLQVFAVRPGITGLAQISGIDMSTPEKLAAADRRYIDGYTFGLDLRILLRTVTGGGIDS